MSSTRLAELRVRTRHTLASCLGLAALAALVRALGSVDLSFALAAGAGTALVMLGISADERRRLLLALVVQGDAGSIADVAELSHRLVHGPGERQRVAAKLRAATDRGAAPTVSPMVTDPGRALSNAPRLIALADAIADERRTVTPGAVAMCRRLVSDSISSPLYNPRMSQHDLDRVLAAVESGIAPAVPVVVD